jgi:hypothetical protein
METKTPQHEFGIFCGDDLLEHGFYSFVDARIQMSAMRHSEEFGENSVYVSEICNKDHGGNNPFCCPLPVNHGPVLNRYNEI